MVRLEVECSQGYHNAEERMLVVKVWGLPELTEVELRGVHRHIVEAAVAAELSSIKTEKDMMVWFPQDLMRYELGEEILAEISSSPSASTKFIFSAAQKIGQALLGLFPRANVECHHISRVINLWSFYQ